MCVLISISDEMSARSRKKKTHIQHEQFMAGWRKNTQNNAKKKPSKSHPK